MIKVTSIIGILLLTSFVSSNFLAEQATKAHFAVLVAGSNGYWNYRHQADAFHAYHILVNNGMPKENIILFAYDDVANNPSNPFPGKVYNKPDPTGPGVDFYEGVTIDYSGKDVTPEVFLAVLQGNAAAVKGKGTGKVLTSTSSDNVFINFTDHGATGLIAFPSEELYADDLIKAFKTMNEKKMYKQLVFYLEACESGSMFQDILPDNISIYASSAANAVESSWGCYCGSEAVVNHKNLNSCLGDLYSVVWMEDSDLRTNKESIKQQFGVVLEKVDKSHPMEWGDKTFEAELVTDFQGNSDSVNESERLVNKVKSITERFFGVKKSSNEEYQRYLDFAKGAALDSRDIKLDYLLKKYHRTGLLTDSQELNAELKHREVVDAVFREFTVKLKLNLSKENNRNIPFACLKKSVNHFKKVCQNFSEYTLKYVKNISNACKTYTDETVINTITEICEN